MKKNILSKVLTFGVIATPILVGTTLIRTSNITTNESSEKSSNKVANPSNKIGFMVDNDVYNLIEKKKSDAIANGTTWDGTLLAEDFKGYNGIYASAFSNRTDVIKITLPNTIKTIIGDAFTGASSLTNLTGYGLTNISEGAFNGTIAIANGGIKLTYSSNINPSKVGGWGTHTSDKYYFAGDPADVPVLTNGVINEGFVKKLVPYKRNKIEANGATWDGSLVESDFVGATSVADNAFNSQDEIKSIIFPTTVKSIGRNNVCVCVCVCVCKGVCVVRVLTAITAVN